MEIEEPVNITIESRQQTEEKQRKTGLTSSSASSKGAQPLTKDKRIPTPKQIEQLKKAREAKAIKKKAIEMMEISNPPKESNESQNELYNTVDYTQYIMPLACVLGSVGGLYFLKKKISQSLAFGSSQPTMNSNNSSHHTQDKQENYSKLQLNF